MSKEEKAGRHSSNQWLARAGAAAEKYRREIDMMSAVFKLTRAGEWPVKATRLATVIGRDVGETLTLASYFGLRVQGELLHYEPSPGPTARFRLHIGDRTVDVGGMCAIDVIWMASAIDVPLHAEATCLITEAPLHAYFTPDGVERLEPPTMVVATLDPQAPQVQRIGIGPVEEIERDVCSKILFFASTEAAVEWLDEQPGGYILHVGDLFEHWRSLSSNVDVS